MATSQKSASEKSPAGESLTKKSPARKAVAKKTAAKKSPGKRTTAMPANGKDPKGGLTAAGRAFYKSKEGANLKPGVTGPADTPEKMKRKGSFLTRHFTHPRGPMIKAQPEASSKAQPKTGPKNSPRKAGLKAAEPTRLALSAHAWGEPIPKTEADAKRLAAKGRKLLDQYHATQTPKASASKGKPARAKPPAKTT